jgi:hypothetical protein
MNFSTFGIALGAELLTLAVLTIRLHTFRKDRTGGPSEEHFWFEYNIRILLPSTYTERARGLLRATWIVYLLFVATVLIRTCGPQ